MSGLGTKTRGSKTGKAPVQPRGNPSSSGARRIWEKVKERISGEHKVPEPARRPKKTPVPDSENSETCRKVCLKMMDFALRNMPPGSPFSEQDFGTVMEKAKAAFNSASGGEDQVNLEVCKRIAGISDQILQAGKAGLFVRACGMQYLEWGARKLADPDIKELCGEMLRKMNSATRKG